MSIETCDPLEALDQALCLEQEGQAFYLRAAERTADAKGAAMFRSLADDERNHAEVIQSRIDALVKGEPWMVPDCVQECDPDLSEPLFPRDKAAFEKAIRPDDSDVDALLFALKVESDSYDLYVEQARSEEDPDAVKMYEYLADAERTHINLLRLNYESLSLSFPHARGEAAG